MNAGPEEVKGQPGVIFFDAAGTLIRLSRRVGSLYSQAAQDHGVGASEAALETAFRSVWREMPHRPPGTVPRENDDRPWWKIIALKTLQRAVEVPPHFDREAWFADLYERFTRPGIWTLYEDVQPCLDIVARKARLAVVSNFDGRLRTILQNLGVAGYFEDLFISSEIGAEKPSPEIFQHAVRAMEVNPEDCLHVGDDAERDATGARAAGLTAFLLDRPQRSLREIAKLYV
jgi:putative hydrolase of the HAD superfamily